MSALTQAINAETPRPRCESGWTGDRCTFPLGHEGFHSNDPDIRPRCVICDGPADDGSALAEVVRVATGSTGIAHAECYLTETSAFDLA